VDTIVRELSHLGFDAIVRELSHLRFDATSLPFFVVSGVILMLALLAARMLRRQRRREARDEQAFAEATSRNLHIPRSLHPIIDPHACIGCLSCLKACPEGDILGVVDGKARLITASNCIGHGECAAECPTDAIRLVFGTLERGVDLPEVDKFFESSRRGVHVVGELGGMGLIKNAITQGVQVSQRLASLKATSSPNITDVAIVGAGPAGLATALGCRAAGLSIRVLEQESLGGTIAHYPRQKIVMTDAVELPLFGKFGKRQISKEELLLAWRKAVAKAQLRIEEGVKVNGLEGSDGAFVVQTNRGALRARKVVLATGRRGSPRKLGVPGEALAKVSYGLVDPQQYKGCRVLVVGGGDSALEAAAQLAEQSNAEVTLSYRGEAFAKCHEANRRKIEALVRARRVSAVLSSQVIEIREQEVSISVGGTPRRLPNDYVLILIGGELPHEMLRGMHISLKRHHGTALGEGAASARARVGSGKRELEAKKNRRLAWVLFFLGASLVIGLTVVGWDYYRLPQSGRLRSPLHQALKPSGSWGHGIGIGATAVMLSNFFYAVRKRWKLLRGAGPIRRWLTFHMFVGFLSPMVIAFHAAFQSNNMLATATAASLAIVVGTGMVGRYIYGLVPTHDGRAVGLADLAGGVEGLMVRLKPALATLQKSTAGRTIARQVREGARQGGLLGLLLGMPFAAVRRRLRLSRVHSLFADRNDWREFKRNFIELVKLRTQIQFYRALRRLLSGWRVFHVVLAIFLVVMIAAHIAVSFYLGYRWIFPAMLHD
jgi:dihydropyrimidine dehydrogenase (NAD+) subunit PreT